eukprot:SAG31_NODE_9491_length_1268_cov_1.491873_2_plen_22_part_01
MYLNGLLNGTAVKFSSKRDNTR